MGSARQSGRDAKVGGGGGSRIRKAARSVTFDDARLLALIRCDSGDCRDRSSPLTSSRVLTFRPGFWRNNGAGGTRCPPPSLEEVPAVVGGEVLDLRVDAIPDRSRHRYDHQGLPVERDGTGLGAPRREGPEDGPVAGGGGTAAGTGKMSMSTPQSTCLSVFCDRFFASSNCRQGRTINAAGPPRRRARRAESAGARATGPSARMRARPRARLPLSVEHRRSS